METSVAVIGGVVALGLVTCACGTRDAAAYGSVTPDSGITFTGSATVTGPLAFAAGMPRAFFSLADGGADFTRSAGVKISNATLCPPTVTTSDHQTLTALAFSPEDYSPVHPGAYAVTDQPAFLDAGSMYSGNAWVTLVDFSVDAGFRSIEATSGTLVFTTLTADRVAGSLDVIMGSADGGSVPLTATFDAPYCSAPGSSPAPKGVR